MPRPSCLPRSPWLGPTSAYAAVSARRCFQASRRASSRCGTHWTRADPLLHVQQLLLALNAPAVAAQVSILADDAVAGNHAAHAVAGACAGDGARSRSEFVRQFT